MIQAATVKILARFLSVNTILRLIGRPCRKYENWRKKLSKEPIPGLKEECQSWIHYWGNGGGDYSTEACITSALDELNSDIPTDISDTIYGSICGYSKSGFEASLLAMDIVNESILELEITKQEDTI